MGFELPLADPVVQLAVLLGAVLVVQLTLERLHVPAVVGLLIFGMLIGPEVLGVLPAEPVVGLFGSVGLVYIMFIAGVEIDLDVVRAHKREAASFGLLAFVLSLVPAVAVGHFMGYGWAGALLLGAALSSHTLLAYPIVERLGLVGTRPVVAAIGGTLLTDTLALVLLVLVMQQAAPGGGALGGVAPLLLLAGLVAAALLVVPRLASAFLDRFEASVRAEKALFVFVVLLLLATAADGIGTEEILGAFLAGICLNQPLKSHPDLHEHVQFVGRMLFIPIFFVDTGMRLELEALTGRTEAWSLALLMLGAIVVGKAGAAWATGALFGYRPAARLTMAALALPQAAATLAVAVTAREAELIDRHAIEAIIIVIFLTCLAGPLATRAAGRRMPATSHASKGSAPRRNQ
jgi:Kef-type K+ transport system membrane component KefB